MNTQLSIAGKEKPKKRYNRDYDEERRSGEIEVPSLIYVDEEGRDFTDSGESFYDYRSNDK